MSWNDDNGPWGPSKKPDTKSQDSKNPWARKDRRPAQGDEDMGPDLEALFRKFQNWFQNRGPSSHANLLVSALVVIFAVWALSGFYQVATDQVGVVMRFGAFVRTENPGLRYHLPAPIETVMLPVVTSQNEIQIGFRRLGKGEDNVRSIPEESMMLTQDENIIDVEFAVFWRISDVGKYLFEIRDPQETIKMAAESAMREVIGQNKLQFALTEGRSQIAEEAKTRLQKLMDEYNAGIVVSQINLQTVSVPDEVKAAFQDVVNARLDQERFQNQAAAHVNKVIPEAKGQAAQMIQQALAYRDQKIAMAQGDADRFKEVLIAYNTARDTTSKRLYLETMESILGNASKVVVDKAAGAGAVPYFPLKDLARSKEGSIQ